MQKKISLFVIIGAFLVLAAGRAAAIPHFTPNEFKTAESLDPGMTQTGINFTLGDDFTSYYAEIRYGMGAMMELGAKFGVTAATLDATDKLGAMVGVDLKYQLIKETEGIPIDLSVDLGYDNTIIKRKNASELTFATIVSKDFLLTDRGYKLVPYGGLAMTALYGSLPEERETFMNVFAGLVWKISQKAMFILELEGGDRLAGGAGVRFEY
jgi:hypothetical protein